jgi:hypothetical protein
MKVKHCEKKSGLKMSVSVAKREMLLDAPEISASR